MNTYLTRYYNRDTDTRNNLLLFKVSQSKYCLTYNTRKQKKTFQALSIFVILCKFVLVQFSQKIPLQKIMQIQLMNFAYPILSRTCNWFEFYIDIMAASNFQILRKKSFHKIIKKGNEILKNVA